MNHPKAPLHRRIGMTRPLVLALILGSMGLVACSSSSTSSTSTPTSVPSSAPSSTADAPATPNDPSTAPDGFVVKGTTGTDVLLDRLWKQGCIPGTNGNDWTNASRTIVGRTLTFTLIDYQNGSTAPDCEHGRVGRATLTVEVSDDGVQVPIRWVDAAGAPASAPDGLEAVTTAVGATGTMTTATITPETQGRADQLNAAKFCGFADWAPKVGRNGVACLTGGVNPFKATLVVDNRTIPWKVYDGVPTNVDANGYPTDMPNALPHQGPYPLPEAQQ